MRPSTRGGLNHSFDRDSRWLGLGVLRDRDLEDAVATRGAYVLGVHRIRQDEPPMESPEAAFHSVLLQLFLVVASRAALVPAFTGERKPLRCPG